MRLISVFSAVCLLVLMPSCFAAEKPLWEVGFGVAPLYSPDYRGSDESRLYILPVPYLIYRGQRFKVDRGGIYSRIFKSGRLTLDLSADGGVPADSSKNQARRGMPDLDATFEIGPSLEICLWRRCDGDRKIQFRLPVRAIFSTDFHTIESRGGLTNPNLNLDINNIGPGGGWNFGVAVGPLFATERYHAYYYDVAPQYATATRPAYNANGGYSGMRFATAVSKRFQRIWVGAYARYDELSGAAFEDSPLRRVGHSFMAGVGIAWVFAQSDKFVDVQD